MVELYHFKASGFDITFYRRGLVAKSLNAWVWRPMGLETNGFGDQTPTTKVNYNYSTGHDIIRNWVC
ncbi:MAG: hypothetical protein F6K40_32300 [Okeania sp. SIO3I5]|uniref:hypothetical protein n=1 Tax=Okeania sp. SIO3I5 TaxID=2607805 RepID=UPI0013B6466D|nr:hypothetical protein [Okeania sp. SIO3I5]NEQ40656.1 hypothetical protein [Okeania sp. SIO3I5]